jgi:hypothetical protein
MKHQVQNDNDDSLESAPAKPALRTLDRRTFLKGALATAPLLLAGPTLWLPRKTQAASSSPLGPSTTTEPYLVPSIDGVKFVSILTVGDAIGNYRMVGIPDGLGAFNSGNGNLTLLMNHEITVGRPGITRAHGSAGAFVSKWTIDRKTLKVLKGEDLTPSPDDVFLWDSATNQYLPGTTVWQLLCSADLPAKSALFANGQGTRERIFFDGEEVSDVASARAWARIVTGPHAGEAWQLPRFGRLSYENALACPHPQDKTIVILNEDNNLNTAALDTNLPQRGLCLYRQEKTRRPSNRTGWPYQRQPLRHNDHGER